MAKNVSTYIKNVGKSLGYAVGDVFTEYNPVVTSLAKQTKETTKSMYESIKSVKISKPDISEKSLKGEINSIKNDIWDGFKSDIKSGNWYNKSKSNALLDTFASSMLGFDDMDMDFDDFDFDDEDWGFDDEDSDTTAKAVVASNNASTKQIIGAVDAVGFKVADTVSNATVESADYIVKSNREVNKAMYNLNQRGFNQVTSALLGVNKSVLEFAKIGEPLTTHMQNAGVFFTNTTDTLNKMSTSLSNIEKNIVQISTNTSAPLSGKGNARSARHSISDIFDDSEGFNIDSYIDMVKENFSEYTDMIPEIKKFAGSLKGKDGSSIGKNISVMSFITKGMVEKVLFPEVMKQAMKSFNETLKYTMGAGILGLRDKSFGNGLGGLLLEMVKDSFLPEDNYKAKINTSNYEKGKVAWDGYSRKALVEVIPGYLSKIYTALTGIEEGYSYDNGKFMSRKELNDNRNSRISRYAKDAGGDFRDDALKVIREMKDTSKEQQEKLTKEVETYFVEAFKRSSDFMPDQKDFKYKNFGLSEESLKILNDLLEKYQNGPVKDENGNYNRAKRNKFIIEHQNARDSFGNDTRRREATGIDDEILLNNGLFIDRTNNKNKKGGIGTANLDRNPVTLLQGILQNTEYLANNIGYISGRTNKVVKNKRKFRGTPTNYFNIKDPKEDIKKAGEKTKEQANKDKYAGLDEDQRKQKEREDNLKNAKKIINDKEKEFSKNFEQGKENTLKKSGLDKIRDFLRKPTDAVVSLLDMASSSMNKLFMGDKESGQKGMIATLSDKLNDKIEELFNVNIKTKIKNFFDELLGKKDETGKRQGGFLRNFIDDTKEELKNAGRWVGNSVKQFFNSGKNKKKSNEKGPVDSAAYGRKVTKSGIVAVSEGELIVPSELNPFYHGTTNKRQQVENESRIIDNFYGAFSKGGTVGETTDEKGSIFEKLGNKYNEWKENRNNDRDPEKEGKGHKFFREGFETIADGFAEFFNRITGNGDKKSEDEKAKNDSNIVKKLTSKFLKEAGDNKGAMGAGALIGGGVSLLTGSVIGPVFGAAIGAATGLAIKSKTVQKLLFGETDKDGNFNGGILSAKMSNFINKNVPTMAKGAAIGGIGGLFMGSPILGAILGSTIGYVKTSEEARQFIFGKVDAKGNTIKEGVISQDLQKKVKKAAPSISAGLILGAVAGPFSLPMNLMVGAGLGYLASANNFHEYLFGKKGDEKDRGLAGLIKDKVIDNLDEIFHNWGNALKASTRNLFKSMWAKISGLLMKKAKAKKDDRGSIIGKILGFGDKVVKGSVNFVGNRLGGINRRRKAKNLRKGYNVYDKNLGRNMFASERKAARGGSTKGTFGALDDYLMQANTVADLDNFQQQIEDLRDPSRIRKRSLNAAMAGLYAGLEKLPYKDSKKIGALVEKGKTDKALEYLKSLGLSENEFAQYSQVIQEAASSIVTADQVKAKTAFILKNFKKKGMDFSKASNIDNALDMIKNERKNQKFSKENQEEKKTETFRDRLTRILASIDINIATFVHGSPSKDSPELVNPVKKKKAKEEKKKNEEKPETIESLLDDVTSDDESNVKKQGLVSRIKDKILGKLKGKFLGSFAGGGTVGANKEESISTTKALIEAEQKPKSKTIFDGMGNPHKIIIDKDGNEVEDMRDKETRQSNSYLDKMKDGIMSLPGIGAAIGGLGGLFKGLTGKLTGDEKKPGLLDKIKGLLDWDGEGPLAKIFKFFTGAKEGKLTSKLASKFSLGTVVSEIVMPALGIAAITNGLDNIASLIPGYSDKSKSESQYTDKETGEVLQKDENGNYLDKDGNIIDPQNVANTVTGSRRFGARVRENAARGVITGKGSLFGSLMKKSKIGKAFTKEAGKVKGLGKSLLKSGGADDAVKIANDIGSDVLSGWGKITKVLRKAPIVGKWLSPIADKLDDMGIALAEKVVKVGTSKGAKALASFLSNAVIWARIALCAYDFEEGYEDASSTLGIIQEATTPQKLVCGLLRVVKNLIPVVGSLIPDEDLIDLFVKFVAPAFGLDIEEFNAQREEAKKTVEEYNKENGTDYSVREYNKTVRKDYTAGERTKNFIKTGVTNTKDRISRDIKGIKNKGLVGYGKQRAGEIKNAFTESYNENGGGVFGAINGIGNAFANIMPGIIGKIGKKNSEIMAFASKGELGNMWKVSLDEFTSDTSKGEASVGIFSKVIGQIPLIITKLGATPVALVSKVVSPVIDKVGSFFGGVIDSAKSLIAIPGQVSDDTEKIINDENSTLKDFIDISKYTNNKKNAMFNGFATAIAGTSRIASLGVMIVKSIGKRIGKFFTNIKDGAVRIFQNEVQDTQTLISYVNQGDVGGMFASVGNQQDDEGNPIGGFRKIDMYIKAALYTPVALLKKIGNTVGGFFGSIKDSIVNTVQANSESQNKIKEFADQGDTIGMFSVAHSDDKDDEGNPLGKIQKAMLYGHAFLLSPVSLIRGLANNIGGFFGPIIDKVKSDQSSYSTAADQIDSIVDDEKSSIGDIWKVDAEFTSPISKLFSFGLGVKKITGTFGKLLSYAMDKIMDILNKVKDGIDAVKELPGKAKDAVVNGAKGVGSWVADKASGAFNAVKDFVTGSGSGIKLQRYSGSGSGSDNNFVSQLDSKYNNTKLGGSTIANNGCAPAVATMVANNLGKNLTMNSAINSAAKYQSGSGTTADYFGNVLGNNGIQTNYLAGNNVADQTMSNLANGNQVILLGRDTNNRSKANSPFGPNGHYVVATGLDGSGNVVVNDPESNRPRSYSPSILSNTNIGIAAGLSGGAANSYDNANAQKIWGYFTSKGYSPAATAGIMGNLFQESGLNPAAIQGGGKGPAAGLAQWENYNTKSKRWANLNALAQQMGYQWSDMDPQLAFIDKEINGGEFIASKSKYYSSVDAFKQATDPMQATEGFELAFERAGKPNMENRTKAASEYYKLYQDSSYTGTYSPGEPGSAPADGSTGGTGDSTGSSESSGPVSILSAISTAFSKIGDLFSFGKSNDSSTSGTIGGTTTGATGADGSSVAANLGPVPEGKGNDAQKRIVQYAESILGKDQYSQDANKRQMVGRGYSDCSSFAQWCYKNAINVDPGGNTGAMADSNQLVTVDEGDSPNVDKLEAGDLLLFRNKTPNGRTKNIGHVEVYDGNGNVIGHGSGQGPTKKNLQKYLQDRAKYGGPYVEARRYKDIVAAGGTSGSENKYDFKARQAEKMAGSGSGIGNMLMDNNPGYRLYGIRIEPMTVHKFNSRRFSGGDSGLIQDTTNMLTGVKNTVTTAGNNGTISADLVQKLIQTITNILEMISNNTAPIAEIYNVLSTYLQGSAAIAAKATEQQSQPTVVNSTTNKYDSGTDPNIINLVGTLGQIARG